MSRAVALQPFFRAPRARAALRREAKAVAIQALWRGASGRAAAADRRASAAGVQAFDRGAVATARHRKIRAAEAALQAFWHGTDAQVQHSQVLLKYAAWREKRAEVLRTTAAATVVQAWWKTARRARYAESRTVKCFLGSIPMTYTQ